MNRRTEEHVIWGHGNEAFRSAHQAFYKLAGRQELVHSDDFYSELETLNIELPPGAIGRIWKTAVDNKIITFSGEMRKSTRPTAHRRRMPVWRSEIFYGNRRKHGFFGRVWQWIMG